MVARSATGVDAPIDRDELAEAVAELLLDRWGVLFRDLAMRESIRFPWRDVQRALRRLEDRGLVQGGRFVAGFSGEQFALPAAAEQLTHVRKLARTGERVTVNATDPCNLVGTIVPGPGRARDPYPVASPTSTECRKRRHRDGSSAEPRAGVEVEAAREADRP